MVGTCAFEWLCTCTLHTLLYETPPFFTSSAHIFKTMKENTFKWPRLDQVLYMFRGPDRSDFGANRSKYPNTYHTGTGVVKQGGAATLKQATLT